MKKLFLILLLSTTTLVYSQKNPTAGQPVDDGLVIGKLSTSTTDPMIVDYLSSLNAAYETARQRSFDSKEEANAWLGFDLANSFRLEQIQKEARSFSTGELSAQFISDLISIRDRIEAGINSVSELRMALQSLASGKLSPGESRCLAMIDLALQRFPSEQQPESLFRMPRWLKCAFSVVSGAITGGFTGGTSGVTIGTAVAPVGGSAVGAVVGSILGVIGGSFGGAALGC